MLPQTYFLFGFDLAPLFNKTKHPNTKSMGFQAALVFLMTNPPDV